VISLKKIKVLWVITNGIKRNGICVSQLDYYKEIDKSRFLIDVVAVHNNTEEMINEYINNGCNVFILPDRQKKLLEYINAFKKLIISNQYDIVHVHGSSTLMTIELKIAKKCGVPIRIAHSRNTTCDRKYVEPILKGIFNKSYNSALACGQEAGKWLFGSKNFTIFHIGKDLKKYSYDSVIRKKVRLKYNIGNKISFGHVGLFVDQKNHTFLIDVFSEIHKKRNDTVLFLMGDGLLIQDIRKKVKSLNLEDSVFFLGSVKNVHEIIQGMDIMLFPSKFEGLPNVVIEWQAAGLPCIISDRITDECCVSDKVYRISIDKGISNWVNKFLDFKFDNYDRQNESLVNCKLLKENGFDIYSNVKRLENYYENTMKKKLLFVSNRLYGGGSERVITTIANYLSSFYDVSIVSYHGGDSYYINDKVKIINMCVNNKFKRIFKLHKLFKELNPDVVISFEYFVNMQVCISNIGIQNKLIISERNDPSVRGNGLKYIRNFLYRFCDKLVCQTEDAKKYFPNYIRKKTIIIPNPVDDKLPAINGNIIRKKQIVSVGRLVSQKNFKLLIDAFAIFNKTHKDYCLKIYGEGPLRNELLCQIRDMNLEKSVELSGFVNNLKEHIINSSLFVLSSDYEGISNAMLEAMAMGIPTICTDCPVGGARMVIKNGDNGLLVPVNDKEKLAEAMSLVIDDDELLLSLSENAKRIRNDFSLKNICDKWIDTIEGDIEHD